MSIATNWTGPFSIYEINTWVWLVELGESLGRPVDLSSVPGAVWDAIAAYGFGVVWLMGVWERSPAGRNIANRNPALMGDFRRCLPDVRESDNVGSAYCVRRYVVDVHLGGPDGLAVARRELARRGIRLLLDFVPNHVAPDAPWILKHPEHFIQGTEADLAADPGAYLHIAGAVFACGRDPYFPAWPDVVQVNAFHPGYRETVVAALREVALQCDGVRCDMAMLLINGIFSGTWGSRAGRPPAEEYWPWLIERVHQQTPGFLFLAEAYWDLEWTLQQQGFAFCYDKRLYDLLLHNDVEGLRGHLGATLAYQQKLVRFVENHDEPRVAFAFAPGNAAAAAILMATVPGATLFHEGQLDGRRVRTPVFLRRRPAEAANAAVEAFYARLLAAMRMPALRDGQWVLCSCSGWPDNRTFRGIIAYVWTNLDERALVVVNFSASPAQALVHFSWQDLGGAQWRIEDALSEAMYLRDGNQLQGEGMYVGLEAWQGQILSFCRE